jgi:hypothetical protein
MSSIAISDLDLTGISLFVDRESYLDEVTSEDFDSIHGGSSPICAFAAASSAECAAFAIGVVRSAVMALSAYGAYRAISNASK